MKPFSLLSMLCLASFFAHAQSDSSFVVNGTDTIKISRQVGRSNFFYYQGERLRMGDIKYIVEGNEEATWQIGTARIQYAFADVLTIVGAAGIGAPALLTILHGHSRIPWYTAGIGAVVVAVSVPIRIAANKTATEAVELYNGGIFRNKPIGRYELKLESTGNTAGLSFTF